MTAVIHGEALPDSEAARPARAGQEATANKGDKTVDRSVPSDSQVPADRPSLDDLAKEINTRFELAAKCESKATDHRIAAGIALNQAHELVRAESKTKGAWGKWLAANVKRSRQDCYKVMKIAAAPDPKSAHEEEKATAREGMQKSRATVANVSDRSKSSSSQTDRRHEKDNYEAAFWIRAEQAQQMAELRIPRRFVTEDMVVAARAVSESWNALARSLEQTLQPIKQGPVQPPAPESNPPVTEPVVNNDNPAEEVIADDPLIALRKQYNSLGDRLSAYDWVMRRLSLGERLEADDKSRVAEFVRSFLATPVTIQNKFRAGIGERPSK